uniref:U3 small nucleolar ribonucleoprotein protein IMP3 n=1 Tax=Arcella intermedia TaxID=1963864 RepID=A0A6B2LKQ4_9EUKA
MVWKRDDTLRQNVILSKYRLKTEEYSWYNKLALKVKKLVNGLSQLPPDDPFRIKMQEGLVDKLYAMGLISTKSMGKGDHIGATAFARRRLSIVLVRNNYCENLKTAIEYIRQGHIRVGPNVVTDPAFFVSRSMEDFITWTDHSKIKKKILTFNDKLDDYDFLGN